MQLGQLKHLKEHQSRFHYKLVCLNMHGPVPGTSTWHFSEEDDDSSGTVAEPHQEIGGVPVDMLVGL